MEKLRNCHRWEGDTTIKWKWDAPLDLDLEQNNDIGGELVKFEKGQ